MNRGGASGVNGRTSCGRRLQSTATCFCSASHAAGVYQSTRALISAENLFWITLRAGVLAFTHGTLIFLRGAPPTQHIYVIMISITMMPRDLHVHGLHYATSVA